MLTIAALYILECRIMQDHLVLESRHFQADKTKCKIIFIQRKGIIENRKSFNEMKIDQRGKDRKFQYC